LKIERRRIMKKMFSVFASVLLLAIAAQAQDAKPQQRYRAFGGTPDERASVRIAYSDAEKKSFGQQFAFDYGTPAWKKDYEDAAKFDAMTRGKVWRFGSNFWTTLDTNIPIKIAGKAVPVGMWYVGLKRSQDGAQWSMVFIDPAKVRSATVDAFAIAKAPIEFEAPLVTEKATDAKDKLVITLTPQTDNPKKVTMRISWGQLQLSAPIEAGLEG
jgi:Protein of unknown function (DUF2911)